MNVRYIVIISATIVFLLYRFLKTRQKNKKIFKEHFSRIENLYEKLRKNEVPSQEEILNSVKNPTTRETTFELLKKYNKISLFPKEYLTIEKGAESNLVN